MLKWLMRSALKTDSVRARAARLGFGVIFAMLLFGGFTLSTQAVSNGKPSEVPEMSSGVVVPGIQPDQRTGFAIFGRPRIPSDAMSTEALTQVGDSTRTGRNASLSRAVRTPDGRGWTVPGNGNVCLVLPDPVDGYGITCSSTPHALAHGLIGLMISSRDPDSAALTIVLPRNSAARVSFEDGRREELQPDDDGVVSVRVANARSIWVETAAGTMRTDLPVPPPAPK